MAAKYTSLTIATFLTLSLFIINPAQARNTSIMADIDLSKVTLWWQYKRDVQIGVGMHLEDDDDASENTLSPTLRYTVKRIDDLRLFVSLEAIGLFNNDDNNDDSGLDLEFGLGGEYFLQRNLSIVVYVAGGNGVNLQYYF